MRKTHETEDVVCRFIKQEAEEKAAEIGVSAEEEFNITKLQVGGMETTGSWSCQ